jgi:hypothetical protein
MISIPMSVILPVTQDTEEELDPEAPAARTVSALNFGVFGVR